MDDKQHKQNVQIQGSQTKIIQHVYVFWEYCCKILTTKFLMVIEIMMKNCLGNFEGHPVVSEPLEISSQNFQGMIIWSKGQTSSRTKTNSCYLRFLANWEWDLFFQQVPGAPSSSCTWSSRYFVLWQIPSSWSSITSRRQQTAWEILIRRCCNDRNK